MRFFPAIVLVLSLAGCSNNVFSPRQSLPNRVAEVQAELAAVEPALSADAQKRYLTAYRKGYSDGGVRKTGYLGRIDLSGRQKHPLQAAYERGHKDAGKDMSMKWEEPNRIDFRTNPWANPLGYGGYGRNYWRRR